MDLASNDNIFISQLVEKCVVPTENVDELSEQNIADPEAVNEHQPLISSSENIEEGNLNESDKSSCDKFEDTEHKINEISEDTETDKDFTNPRGIRFVQYDEQVNLQPYGLACVRELFR